MRYMEITNTEIRPSEIMKERRVAADRRKFNYTAHSPERRSGLDRRNVTQNLKVKVA